MQELIETILENVAFEKKENFEILLRKCLSGSKQSRFESDGRVFFQIQLFFNGIEKITNALKKDLRMLRGMETLHLILTTLGYEVEIEDSFILFHLRNLGKFKIREDKLLAQLKSVWGEYPDYALSDHEFGRALKSLRHQGLIQYRKRNLSLEPMIFIDRVDGF